MTLLDQAIRHTIGGGWGSESDSPGTRKVGIIRGADFPRVSLQQLEGIPERFESAKKIASRSLEIGDIVLETSGGTSERPTGRTVFITERLIESSRQPLIPASFCRLLRIDESVAHPRFVYYALQDLYNRGLTWNYQNQSTGISNFQFELLRNSFEIPDTGLNDQQAIAEVLGALDDKIAANARESSTLDDLASTMVEAALTNDKGGERLSDIAQVVMGSSPKGEDLNSDREGTVFYQGIRDFGLRFPSRRIWASKTTRLARPGDTLLSVRAPVGTVNLAEETSCIGRGLAAVTSTQNRPYTLFHLLKLAKAKWEPFNSSGTVYGSINRRQLETITVPVVCVGQEDQLESKLTALEDKLCSLIRESRALSETRDALLPQLMSGKLRVRDAAQIVSDAV